MPVGPGQPHRALSGWVARVTILTLTTLAALNGPLIAGPAAATGPVTTASTALTTRPAPGGDYDGDGLTDEAAFRPSNGTWLLHLSTGGSDVVAFGTSGDVPVPGDYNGDGRTDIAVYRPTEGAWYIQGQAGAFWGTAGDVPVPGDYNGDGRTDIAVYRPSQGAWYIQGQPGALWGAAGDIPIPADYNGDGTTDVAVFRPSQGVWYVQGQAGAVLGTSGDIPLPLPVALRDPVLSVTEVPANGGRVVSDPSGIDCPPTCSAAFPLGTSVGVSATASPGYVFWRCSVGSNCTVTMDGPHAVEMDFAEGTGLCGVNPQTKHSNGLGQYYFDCNALGSPGNASTYSQTMAVAAASAWAPGGTISVVTCGTGFAVNAIENDFGGRAAIWQFSGTVAGHVFLNPPGQFGCPLQSDLAWN